MFKKILQKIFYITPSSDELRADALSQLSHMQRLCPQGVKIIQRLQKYGYQAFFVGGCIRDILLGQCPKDFDIVTNAKPREIASLFSQALVIGKRFTLVHIKVQDELFEVATFRKPPPSHTSGEILSHDNHFGNLGQDWERRDFSVNALYYDPIAQQLIDPSNGLQDLYDQTLRVIGEPQRRFSEDPVRMIRALRYAAKLGLKLESEITKTISKNSLLLLKIPKARLYEEYLKCFLNSKSTEVFNLLYAQKIIRFFIPKQCLQGKNFAQARTLIAQLNKMECSKLHKATLLLACFLYPVWVEHKRSRETWDKIMHQFSQLIAYLKHSDFPLRDILSHI